MPATPKSKSKAKTVSQRAKAEKNAVPAGRGHRFRIAVVQFFFILALAVISARLIQLHLYPHPNIRVAEKGHIGKTTIFRPRGDIYDRRGNVLATDKRAMSLAVDPSRVEDPDVLTWYLHRRLNVDKELIRSRLSQRDSAGNKMRFVWVKRRLTQAELSSLDDRSEISGAKALMFSKEMARYYPEGDLASHVLGFSNGEGQGAEGIELAYDQYLRSQSGQQVGRVDRKRVFLPHLTLEYKAPAGGDDVYLTVDRTLQYTLEQALDEAMLKNKAPHAMGIMMDPDTGAVLAMASRSGFDPNEYWKFSPAQRKNRAIVDVFEPGSAFKIVAAAAALEQGLITMEEAIDCEGGSYNPYGHRISDAPGHHLGVVPFSEAFAQSSNVGIIKVAALLGPERFESWVHKFGFGQLSGADIPGESRGILRSRNRWSKLSMGALPMGQEVAVTMFQLARAFSVIANDGFLIEPYMVERAVSEEGISTYQHEAKPPQRVLSQETAELMRELCHYVVASENGTGKRAAIPEYRVGGKTGTAQIAMPNGGGYYDDKYTTVFAGFAPVRDPRIVCVIVVSEPNIRNHYGGYVCGPVFKKVVREALVRMNVPKDPMVQKSQIESPPPTMQLALAADSDTVTPRVVLDVMDIPDDWSEGTLDGLELLSSTRDTTNTDPTLPDFTGLTKPQAISELVTLGIRWDPQGAGRVIRQDPAPGTPLSDVRLCKLVFSQVKLATTKQNDDI